MDCPWRGRVRQPCRSVLGGDQGKDQLVSHATAGTDPGGPAATVSGLLSDDLARLERLASNLAAWTGGAALASILGVIPAVAHLHRQGIDTTAFVTSLSARGGAAGNPEIADWIDVAAQSEKHGVPAARDLAGPFAARGAAVGLVSLAASRWLSPRVAAKDDVALVVAQTLSDTSIELDEGLALAREVRQDVQRKSVVAFALVRREPRTMSPKWTSERSSKRP